ncbi:uncharacterized protein LOC110095776 [Dendrobium catenatum]|uniref:uncharacterized protein LOC110095776 n=1 Tax=Dendrobium catenatum TaxID=906689 RepID=UPI0009F1F24D|nr:uncharacterized protein LOC110095776 [Dendrobium catenatum]
MSMCKSASARDDSDQQAQASRTSASGVAMERSGTGRATTGGKEEHTRITRRKNELENCREEIECSAKREVEEGMEEGVHESERMHESEGLTVYKDEKEAYECFCTYAHDNGFSVQKDHHSFWPNSRKIKSKDFVCSKAGFKKSIDLNSRKRFTRPYVRTGCPSMVRFVTDEDGY